MFYWLIQIMHPDAIQQLTNPTTHGSTMRVTDAVSTQQRMAQNKKQTRNSLRSTLNKNLNSTLDNPSLSSFITRTSSESTVIDADIIIDDVLHATRTPMSKNDISLPDNQQGYNVSHTPSHTLKRTPPTAQQDNPNTNPPPQTSSQYSATLEYPKRKRQSNKNNKDNSTVTNTSNTSNDSYRGKRKAHKRSNDESDSSTDFSQNDEDYNPGSDPNDGKPLSKIIMSLVEYANEINYVRRNSTNLNGVFNSRLKTVENALLATSHELEPMSAEPENNKKLIEENLNLIKINRKLTEKVKQLESRIEKLESIPNILHATSLEQNKNPSPSPNKLFLESLLQSINENIDSKIKDLKTEILAHVNNNTTNPIPSMAIHQNTITPISSSVVSLPTNTHSPNPNAQPRAPEMWAKVVGKKSKKKIIATSNDAHTYLHNTNTPLLPASPSVTPMIQNTKPSVPIRKPKNVEVLYITESRNSNTKINQVLSKAKENINLQELGIKTINPRASLNGGLILEFPKSKEGEVAPILMEKIKSLFPPDDIVVSCPKKYKEALFVQTYVARQQYGVNVKNLKHINYYPLKHWRLDGPKLISNSLKTDRYSALNAGPTVILATPVRQKSIETDYATNVVVRRTHLTSVPTTIPYANSVKKTTSTTNTKWAQAHAGHLLTTKRIN
ncbi:ras guanine nucleotide exchange factor Y-like [Ceratina calcarata]|uniref:Ras guanine nucleotide exchange factor Y-like n=1 Tax=Ceratina calcarata TaxID=156304 RepID=A0AAJ7S9H8_9HYME|nr:ras guanine nucleotide exchange factor Y-like [Ceratina calcarata]XP_026673352.1 ras guanine nucleotide exchange factor Y-like [Ceratina calcarata]XP_026673357.1 ras guanine nucleotide exchange factor Y-like [Ceratina calcarata]XP_026673363.1 ras guanine nucleotide exchange factor Y-like [Ceratina calcarata]XP_026673367.1 ras guanine nucleotide exchange factor Y-like [Ceratina calcarata]